VHEEDTVAGEGFVYVNKLAFMDQEDCRDAGVLLEEGVLKEQRGNIKVS